MRYCLNISPAKTGNSFIQQFLLRQERQLDAQGVYFLKNTYAPHQPHYQMVEPVRQAISTGKIDVERMQRLASDYFGFVDSNRHSTIVQMITGGLMGEPLGCSEAKTRAALTALKHLTRDGKSDLVAIIRRQDRYLESYYLQRVQGGDTASFQEYLDQVNLEAISWWRALEIAGDIFGSSNITVYPFECITRGEEPFLRRFVACFADPDAFDYKNLDIPKNRSYSGKALAIALAGNVVLDQSERKLLRAFLQKNFSNATHPRAELFTPEQRAEVLAMHAAGNRQVFDTFCPEDNLHELGYLR